LKCHYCGKEVTLPFKCPFCGQYFCEDHRLPENHNCPELWRVRTRSPPPVEREHILIPRREVKGSSMMYPFKATREEWTSITEIYHLTIGAVAVMAVGLSLMGQGFSWVAFIIQNPIAAFSSAFLFMTLFISHELAHKISAKHFGLWAEFRLNIIGISLTILSIFSPLIKVVSPGTVVVSGVANREVIGKIAFAGPLTNIILAFLLYSASLHPLCSSTNIALGALLSIWIALLNLIPAGMFDGAKIFWWNKMVWAASFCISLILLVLFLFF